MNNNTTKNELDLKIQSKLRKSDDLVDLSSPVLQKPTEPFPAPETKTEISSEQATNGEAKENSPPTNDKTTPSKGLDADALDDMKTVEI